MHPKRFFILLVVIGVSLCSCLWCSNAQAISIKEEQRLSKEFLKVLEQHAEFIDDPLINDYVDQVGRKVLTTVAPQPFSFTFHVIKEDVYNAFAIPAGHVFINSGLLMAMDSEDELAGILSHEISHVVCRHISRRIERSKKIDAAAMAGVVAGIFLGAAVGDPAVAQGMVFGSAAAGQAAMLQFSRDDEVQADQLGLGYLAKAGYSAEGLLDILNKIRNRQWFGTDVVPSYMMTHPAVEQRIVDIHSWMAMHQQTDGQKSAQASKGDTFLWIRYRLKALYGDPATVEPYFQAAVREDHGPALDYGYALLLTRLGRRTEAQIWLRKALARKAMDPIILTELGRIYFLDGNYQDALGILKGVVSLPGPHSEAEFYLGRALLNLKQYQEAAARFENLLKSPHIHPETYRYLGEAYSRMGNEAYAYYYMGMFYYNSHDAELAMHHLTKARNTIKDPKKLEEIKKILEEIRPQPGSPQ